MSAPPGRHLCNDRGHRNAGRLADVLVTFGVFGSHVRRDAFWPDVWGRTYPLCDSCWAQTLAVLQHVRPCLVISTAPTLVASDRRKIDGSRPADCLTFSLSGP